MSWNGGCLSVLRIEVYGVTTAFTKERTPMPFKIVKNLTAFHSTSTAIFSRMVFLPLNSFLTSSRLDCKMSPTASRRFSRASRSVFPCVLAPGSSSTYPTYQLPIFLKTAVNVFFIGNVYHKNSDPRIENQREGSCPDPFCFFPCVTSFPTTSYTISHHAAASTPFAPERRPGGTH